MPSIFKTGPPGKYSPWRDHRFFLKNCRRWGKRLLESREDRHHQGSRIS
ncbi:MAG: hypothetical protein VX675_00800 [Planctomycetota bacterium]|nr:hypothetical protein [Planctomycetota bacterium]